MDVLKKIYFVPAGIRTTDHPACSLITVTASSDSTRFSISCKSLRHITVVNVTATLYLEVCLLNCFLRLQRDKGSYISVHTKREITIYVGDRGSTVVKVLCYKSEGRWFDSRWCRNFSLT